MITLNVLGIVDLVYSDILKVMGKNEGDIDQTNICRAKLPYGFTSGADVSGTI